MSSVEFQKMPHCWFSYTLSFMIILACLLSSGCVLPTGVLRSRWAMDDPEYAEKYANGATKLDILGKLKQASDARFVDGAHGLYVSGGLAARPESHSQWAGAELGYESYLASFVTARGAFMLMSDGDEGFTGADAGVRLQVPARLAPFVGAGVYAGYAKETVPADDDGEDNDDDGFIDEFGEDRERFSGSLAAVYPEVGSHLWWTPTVRLTGFGRYLVTTHGRREDDWLIGAGIAIFSQR